MFKIYLRLQLLLTNKYPCSQLPHCPGLVQFVQDEILEHEAEINGKFSNSVHFCKMNLFYHIQFQKKKIWHFMQNHHTVSGV